MEIKNDFEVPLPPAEAWKVLMDIERIAPCMPGAELLQVIDPQSYKGKVSVRLGPVALAFVGTARFEEVDEAAHSARVKAQGTDSKGRGGANAVVAFKLAPVPAGTRVDVHTNLNLSGSVAQYGRGTGMIQDVATQLIGQFATSLRGLLAHDRAPEPATADGADTTAADQAGTDTAVHTAPAAHANNAAATPKAAAYVPPPAKPISGFSLMARVLWNAVLRMFKRA